MIATPGILQTVGGLLLATTLVACSAAPRAIDTSASVEPVTTIPGLAVETSEPVATVPSEPPATTTSEPAATPAPAEELPVPSPASEEPSDPVGAVVTVAPSAGVLVCDPLNDFTLQLPDGWRAITPTDEGMFGLATVMNYTEEELAALGAKAQEGLFPPGAVKVDIGTWEILPGTFQEFVDERIGQTMSGPAAERTTISEPQPYNLAGYSGVTYTITEAAANENVSAPPPWQSIVLSIAEDRVATMGIVPADSTAYDTTLDVLATFTMGECSN